MSVNVTIKTENMICTDISGTSIDPIIQPVESVNGEIVQAIVGYRVILLREGVGASESPRLNFKTKEEAERTYQQISEQIFKKTEENLKNEHYKNLQTSSLKAILPDDSLDLKNKIDEVEIENEISQLIKDLEEVPVLERLGYAFTWLSGHSDDPWISNLASIFENKQEKEEVSIPNEKETKEKDGKINKESETKEIDDKSFVSEEEKDFVKSMIKQASVNRSSVDSFAKNLLTKFAKDVVKRQTPKMINPKGIPVYEEAIKKVIEELKFYLKLANTDRSKNLVQSLEEASPFYVVPTLISDCITCILYSKNSDELFMKNYLIK